MTPTFANAGFRAEPSSAELAQEWTKPDRDVCTSCGAHVYGVYQCGACLDKCCDAGVRAVAPSPIESPSLFNHILSIHAAAAVATARALAVEDEEPLTGNPYIDRRNGQYAQWEDRDE